MTGSYELMHTDKCVATIDQSGRCHIFNWQFMPYDLYLEDTETDDNNQNPDVGDVDTLVGNTDRHLENWGFLVDNCTNKPVSLYPLMDFNQSFFSYNTLDGSLCQTTLPRRITQREAAEEAARKIGLRQIKEIDLGWFEDWTDAAGMFVERLALLRNSF